MFLNRAFFSAATKHFELCAFVSSALLCSLPMFVEGVVVFFANAFLVIWAVVFPLRFLMR
jgi:hypothetical protein